MTISPRQISLFTEDTLTSSPVASLVNPTQPQESERGKRMNATSGLACLGQFERLDHVGSWAKTFAGLLVGMEGWSSKRCKLNWKLKGTKYNRFYFQLQASTPRTEGDRVWFVAYSNNQGGCGEPREVPSKDGEVSERNNHAEPSDPGIQRNAKDSNKDGWGGNEWEKESNIRQQWDISSGDNERLPTDYAKVRNATDPSGKGLEGGTGESIQGRVTRFTKCSNDGNVTDPDSEVLEYRYGKGEAIERAIKEERTKSFSSPGEWGTFPTVSPICSRNDGLSNRLDGITFPKWRNESIKAGGNAIVPQVALQIFKAIQKYESNY
jgi:hypothetical protein